jgi:PAS domain S-box-containing protein
MAIAPFSRGDCMSENAQPPLATSELRRVQTGVSGPQETDTTVAGKRRDSWTTRAAAVSLEGQWNWELGSDVFECSARCLELLGYGKDEIPPTISLLRSAVHPEDVETAALAVRRCKAEGGIVDDEFRLRTKAGKYRWFRCRGRIQPSDSGHAAQMAGVLQDITDRKLAEEALRERLRFERLLADLSARFLNAPSEGLDALIERSLQTLVEFLGNDRSALVRITDDKDHVLVTHSYAVPGCKPYPVGKVADKQLPWYIGQFRKGNNVFARCVPDALPPEATEERDYCQAEGLQSNVAIALRAGGTVVGAITFGFLRRRCEWSDEILSRLRMIGEVFANVLQHRRADEALRAALEENETLRCRLEQENQYLREQVVLKHRHGRIIGQSDALKAVLSQLERVAVTDAPVLLFGETGTGKELLAQTIHELSARQDRPMVIVNCASLPATLVESELFGREAGAYTGAASAQVGRFVVADGSTLFLDEVGEFPIELQAKLLRVLQDGRFERLGSPETLRVNVRIIAATNRDLGQAVLDGKFRADLYHRLNVFPIHVPPLRERREDIPPLAWAFVESIGRRMGKTIKTIPRRSMDQLQRYTWPGNVRELSNVIERAMILATDDTLRIELPLIPQTAAAPRMTLKDSQRAQILRVLDECGWRIRGASGAAQILGLKPTTLEARMAKLGIRRDKRISNIS